MEQKQFRVVGFCKKRRPAERIFRSCSQVCGVGNSTNRGSMDRRGRQLEHFHQYQLSASRHRCLIKIRPTRIKKSLTPQTEILNIGEDRRTVLHTLFARRGLN
jgi:hypothetical protein